MKLLIDSPNFENGVIVGYFLKVHKDNGEHSGKYMSLHQYEAVSEIVNKPAVHVPVIEKPIEPEYVSPVTAIEEALAISPEPVIEQPRRGRPRK